MSITQEVTLAKFTAKTLIRYAIFAGLLSFVVIFVIMQITSGFNFLEAFSVIAHSKWWWMAARVQHRM